MGASILNIFQLEKEVTITLLETNIGTTNADAQTLQADANANEALTQNWLSNPETELTNTTNPNQLPYYNSSNPPNTTTNCPYSNPVYNAFYVDVMLPMQSANPALVAAVAAATAAGPGTPVNYPPGTSAATLATPAPTNGSTVTSTGQTGFQNFSSFFNTYLTSAYQDNISDALTIQITNVLSNPSIWPSSTDTNDSPIASGFLTQITAFKSNIDALASEEEQIGKTDSNMEQSVLSLDGNASSSFTAVFSSLMEGMDVSSNILQQGV